MTDEYVDIMARHARQMPRNLQVALGPSELGNGCDRCLIHLLAGHKGPLDSWWLPCVGTAVHTWLESVFRAENDRLGRDRFLVEMTVPVGVLRGWPVTGHLDLYDRDRGCVIDWKVVGSTTLKKIKAHGTPTTYQNQRHLYGLGASKLGLPVYNVANYYLPRNAMYIERGLVVDEQEFDPDIADAALARAEMFSAWVDSFGADAVLDGAPPHTGDEFTCTSFPDTPVGEPASAGPVMALSL